MNKTDNKNKCMKYTELYWPKKATQKALILQRHNQKENKKTQERYSA